MSMKPGATIRPEASISCFASMSPQSPMALIRPSLTATSARRAGVSLPSITPPQINWSSMRCSLTSGSMADGSNAGCGPAIAPGPNVLAVVTGSEATPSGGMGTVYARTASCSMISRESTQSPLISLLVGNSPPPQPDSEAGTGCEPAKLSSRQIGKNVLHGTFSFQLVRIALCLCDPHLNKLKEGNCGPVSQTRDCEPSRQGEALINSSAWTAPELPDNDAGILDQWGVVILPTCHTHGTRVESTIFTHPFPSTCWMVHRMTSRRLVSSNSFNPCSRPTRMYSHRSCPRPSPLPERLQSSR